MYDWTKVEHLLGVVPDVVVADVMGARQTTVSIHRSKEGIGRNVNRRNMGRVTLWSPEMAPIVFENLTDEEIAARFKMDLEYVQARRWIYELHRDGKVQEFRDSVKQGA